MLKEKIIMRADRGSAPSFGPLAWNMTLAGEPWAWFRAFMKGARLLWKA